MITEEKCVIISLGRCGRTVRITQNISAQESRFIMLKIIIGVKGTGKTKTLVEMVNTTAEQSEGSVVCLEKGEKNSAMM